MHLHKDIWATQVMPGTGQELVEGTLPAGTEYNLQPYGYERPNDRVMIEVPVEDKVELYLVRYGDLER